MKVLHINSNYFYTKLHKELITYLDKVSENTVFSPMIENPKNIKVKDDSVIAPSCFNKFDRLMFYNKQRKIIKSMTDNIDVVKHNLVHAHTLFTDGNVAYKTYKKHKIPYIVTVRNTDINAFFKKRIFLRSRGVKILKNASAVIFLSKNYKNNLLDKYIKSNQIKRKIDEKSYIIPNGINDFWFENLNKPKSINNLKLNCLYVGRIEKNKNLLTTVKALNLLHYNIELSYNIVGKIHDVKLFKTLKKYDFIKFYGELTPEELISVYRSNDIFIMPSIFESFGLVYVEAMTQGLPVIYSKGQGFDGQFADGLVGYGVDKYDEKDIVNKVKLIIKEYDKISKNTIHFSDEFKWGKIAKKYASVYKVILRKS